MAEPELKNGDEVLGTPGHCDFCGVLFGGSATPRKSKYLNGKFYHLECYPKAVDVYLADLKLQGAMR